MDIYSRIREIELESAFQEYRHSPRDLAFRENKVFTESNNDIVAQVLEGKLSFEAAVEAVFSEESIEPKSEYLAQLREILGENVLLENWYVRARHLDERIQSHRRLT